MIYIVLGAFWILVSDWLLDSLLHDRQLLIMAQSLKGWLFVAGSGVLFYVLLRRELMVRERVQTELARVNQTLGSLFTASPVAMIGLDDLGLVNQWNAAAEQMLGWAESEVTGRPLPVVSLVTHRQSFARALTGELQKGEERVWNRKDGSTVDVRVFASPLTAPDGRPAGLVVLAADISQRKALQRTTEETQHRLEFLAEASRVLTGMAGDCSATLLALAEIAVPRFADWCIVDIVTPNGEHRRAAVVQADSAQEQVRQQVHAVEMHSPSRTARIQEVLGYGRPRLATTVTEQHLENVGLSQDELLLARRMGLRSGMILPIQARGRSLGALTFLTAESGRTYGAEDLALAEELARRAGTALDNAILLRETSAAERAVRQRAVQLRGLTEASLALQANLPPREMLQLITNQARIIIGAHLGSAILTEPETGGASLEACSLSDKYASWRDRTLHIDGTGIYGLVLRGEGPLRLTQTELEGHPAFGRYGDREGLHPPLRGLLAVPMPAQDGSVTGLIQLSDKFDGDFTEDDEVILIQLARIAAAAVERACGTKCPALATR